MMEAGIERPDLAFPAFFRFRKVDGDYVVTNAQGDFGDPHDGGVQGLR